MSGEGQAYMRSVLSPSSWSERVIDGVFTGEGLSNPRLAWVSGGVVGGATMSLQSAVSSQQRVGGRPSAGLTALLLHCTVYSALVSRAAAAHKFASTADTCVWELIDLWVLFFKVNNINGSALNNVNTLILGMSASKKWTPKAALLING